MSVTGDLVDILIDTRFGDIPGEALEIARQVTLDGIGVMIGAARWWRSAFASPSNRPVRRTARLGPAPPSGQGFGRRPVLGKRWKTAVSPIPRR